MHIAVAPPDEQPPFSDEDVRLIVAACRSQQEHLIFLALLNTGVRASELLGLAVHDLDFQRGEIAVLGKGHKRRRVACPLWLMAELRSYASDGFFVFESRQRSGCAISYGRLLQLFHRLGQRAGVEKCHPHRCRTTFAVMFMDEGGDVGALSRILGHRSLSMSLFYARWGEGQRAMKQQRQFANALQRRLLA